VTIDKKDIKLVQWKLLISAAVNAVLREYLYASIFDITGVAFGSPNTGLFPFVIEIGDVYETTKCVCVSSIMQIRKSSLSIDI
jgi:hypothetical protein